MIRTGPILLWLIFFAIIAATPDVALAQEDGAEDHRLDEERLQTDSALHDASDAEALLAPLKPPGGPCVSDPEAFWICEGDPAFATGYLLAPQTLDMRLVPLWEEKANKILPIVLKERDAYRLRRDVWRSAYAIERDGRRILTTRLYRASVTGRWLLKREEARQMDEERERTYDVVLCAIVAGVSALSGAGATWLILKLLE